ncbi:hypothetical protein, partial [Bacteroides intestinalis]|uniref:hypothetical protein n=1 Tax=Bacteroides intestinalis TaxID=329854 RepID=UPI001C709B10
RCCMLKKENPQVFTLILFFLFEPSIFLFQQAISFKFATSSLSLRNKNGIKGLFLKNRVFLFRSFSFLSEGF